MPQQVGMVPLYADDQTGELFVDSNDAAGEVDDDESGFLGFGRRSRLRRIDRRLGRLGRRRERILDRLDSEDDMADAAPADLYQTAAAAGLVMENQYNGLGSVTIPASSTGQLSDTINRNLWGKSLVLDSDSPSSIIVTSITIAGLPINVGSKGTPLAMFATNSTRFGISFGRKMALVGQAVVVSMSNIDSVDGHDVLGGMIADEMNYGIMSRVFEQMLLTAVNSAGPLGG